MWGYHDGMGWWMLFGGLFTLMFWAIVIGLVVWGVNRIVSGSKGNHSKDGESAFEMARRRLARGEITKDQWEEIKRELR